MGALGRLRRCGGDRAGRVGRAGTRNGLRTGGGTRAASVHDAVDASSDIVGDIQRAVRPDRESARTMRGFAGRFVGPRKSVGEYLALARCLIARQPLIYDVVAALRVGGAIPRTMKGDEQALLVVGGELLLVVE